MISPISLKLTNVRQKSWLIEWLPGIGQNTATAIYPYVYLPRSIYKDVHDTHPSPYNIALVLHEQEHITRAKNYGVMRWYLRYIFSPRFRFEEELAAYVPQMAYLKRQDLAFDVKRKAKGLSSWLYGRPVGYDEVFRRVNQLWESM